MASGDFATWINSDDLLCKNALVEHVTQIGCAANTVYVGNCLRITATGKILSVHRGRVHSLEDLLRISRVWRARGQIVQPEVLFPRDLALAVGGLNRDNHYTMDYELWGKFFLAGARFQYTNIPFGMFRSHSDQKTHNGLKITESLLATGASLLHLANSFSEETRKGILADFEAYKEKYQKSYWKRTGRLAKMGLPPVIVNPLRKIRARVQKSLL
jgi:hypothetical protein